MRAFECVCVVVGKGWDVIAQAHMGGLRMRNCLCLSLTEMQGTVSLNIIALQYPYSMYQSCSTELYVHTEDKQFESRAAHSRAGTGGRLGRGIVLVICYPC